MNFAANWPKSVWAGNASQSKHKFAAVEAALKSEAPRATGKAPATDTLPDAKARNPISIHIESPK